MAKSLNVGVYAKAIVAALSAGAATALVAMQDGVVSPGEGVTIALSVLGALGVTYAVPNDSKVSNPAEL